jgi:sulfite reductase alpha subunit-like flavoprotein
MAWHRFHSWRRTPKDFITEESVMNMNIDQAMSLDQHEPEAQTVDVARTHSLSEAPTSAPNGGNGHARATQDLARERATALFNGTSALILYTTVTGNAESLANMLAEMLRRIGLTAHIRDMAHCQPNVLTQAKCVLVVASTYGDGEPPDDAAPFWEAIVHGYGLDLSGVKYSVLALGNTTYDHFCKCGRELDAALERHGALRFYPRVDCDVDYEAAAEAWIDGVSKNLQQVQCAAASA